MATAAGRMAGTREPAALGAPRVERIVSLLVLAAVIAAIAYGWTHRDGGLPDPEHGLGYALGIIGGSMMLLLLGYPLRKRTRRRAMGSVGFWFRFHMFLGLAGPLAVLFHSRFTFGSLNSAMALWAMLIVASSGLVGRFFYAKVHRGFSNRKLELRALKQDMDSVLAELEASGFASRETSDLLHRYENQALAAGQAFWSSGKAILSLGIGSRIAQRRIIASLGDTSQAGARRLETGVRRFFEAVRRAAEFAFYDRLLRLWHLFHLPLFVMLVAAAILHIIAVHRY